MEQAPSPSFDGRLAALRSEFETVFGLPGRHLGVAPGRVNLIGEHTDYNGGLCLPMALEQSTFAMLAPRTDGLIRLVSREVDQPWAGSIDQLRPGTPHGWAGYAAGVLWALPEWLPGGVDLMVESEVPLGAGLSSSAALTCAVAMALASLHGIAATDDVRDTVVSAAHDAENRFVGSPTGRMDQTVALFAQPAHALLIDFGSDHRHQVPFDPAAAGLSLLVTDTRATHQLLDGQYAARRADCRTACQVLGLGSLREARASDLEAIADLRVRRRARHVISEIARVRDSVELIRAGRLRELGPLFAASHASLRDDYEVSCAELDLAVGVAIRSGALAARMTGAGFGGSVISLVPSDGVSAVIAAVNESFRDRDLLVPRHLVANPGPPARSISL